MVTIRVTEGTASFSTTLECVRLSTLLGCIVVCTILGKDRYFTPGLNANEVYDFNNDRIGVVNL